MEAILVLAMILRLVIWQTALVTVVGLIGRPVLNLVEEVFKPETVLTLHRFGEEPIARAYRQDPVTISLVTREFSLILI